MRWVFGWGMASVLESQLGVLRSQLEALDEDWLVLTNRQRNSRGCKKEFSLAVRQCNQLVLALRPQLGPECRGLQRQGPRSEHSWGHWIPCSPDIAVAATQARVDALPVSRVRRNGLRLSWSEDGYLVFNPSTSCNQPQRLHRAYWQDVFCISLPSWVDVDHQSGWKDDCRLSNLQLLTHWENAGKGGQRPPTGNGVAGSAAAAAAAAAVAAAAVVAAALAARRPPPPPPQPPSPASHGTPAAFFAAYEQLAGPPAAKRGRRR